MILPESNSCDTSDGSEQHRDGAGAAAAPVQGSGQTASQRWADDGGPGAPAAIPACPPAPLLTKPAWSVLPLADLREAIRRASRADDPSAVQQREAASARRNACAAAAAEDQR